MPQVLTQQQTLKQSPQQYLIATLLECTSDELEKRINEELQKNFALAEDDHTQPDLPPEDTSATSDHEASEEGEQDVRIDDISIDPMRDSWVPDDYGDDEHSNPNASPDDALPSPLTTARTETSFREDLRNQLALMDVTEEERFLATYLIESLDDDGYLRFPLPELVDDLELTQRYTTTEPILEAVLTDIVQDLEPAGIGARNARECLMLQLQERRNTAAAALAYRILDRAFDDYVHRRYERICQSLGITMDEFREAQLVISTLNPAPGGMQGNVDEGAVRAGHIRPDFIVHEEDGHLVVALNDPRVPDVCINPEYRRMMEDLKQSKSRSEDHRSSVKWIREGITSARGFIEALRQRRRTLLAVMKVIVAMQHDYFMTGDREVLRPMVLREVAERSGYDISTISRISRSKYVETDFGLIRIKQLFTTAIPTTGKKGAPQVSNAAVKEALRSAIDAEDKSRPMTDDELVVHMTELGYPIARRTVVKYRKEMGYNKASLRREIG